MPWLRRLIALAAAAGLFGGPSLAQTIDGCPLFPPDNIWNAAVDRLPVDPGSDAYLAAIGISDAVHPDFGSGIYPPETGGPIGIPYVTVPASQPLVPVSFLYDDESDPGPYPIPPDPPIEGGPQSDGDRHVLVLDQDRCRLFELFNAFPQPDGSWIADAGAIFDLRSHALRTDTWTSADAAGLPVLPGLVRYDEVASGEIRHALRFTAPRTRKAHVWPARHDASSRTEPNFPPMGQRFRLRGDFDESDFAPEIQVILRALKKYGMMLADNGSAWFLSGVPDERWDNDVLRQLRRLRGSDFEAVDVSSLQLDPDSGRTRAGASEPLFLPQVGNGVFGALRFSTRFIFVGKSAESGVSVDFFDANGQPLPLALQEGARERVEFTLAGGEVRFLESTGNGEAQVGYARIRTSGEIGGLAVFSVFESESGVRLSETAVDLALAQTDFYVTLDSIGAADTGVALVNPPALGAAAAQAATITVRLYNEAFELLAEATLPELAEGAHRARFVREFFEDPSVAALAGEMRGLVSFHSDTPLVALALLQRDDPATAYPEDVPTLTAFPVFSGRPGGAGN